MFDTPAGANIGGQPVDAEAVFTTSGTTMTVTLKDLEANPTDVAQLLSDLLFHVSIGNAATATLTGSSGQEVSINPSGNPTLGATVSTGWMLEDLGGNLRLHVLGTSIAPSHLIIGPPAGSGVYTAANGSIDDNGPHNPFLNDSATFTLTIPGMSADTIVDSATFSFGTTEGNNIQGVPTVPDGGTTVLLLGTALSALGFIRRKLA